MDSRGRESLVGFATSSDWLGSAAVLANQPVPVSAVTCSKAALQRYPVDTFRKLLSEDRQVSTLVQEAHAREVCRQSIWIGQLCSSDSSQRLRSVLSRFAKEAVQTRSGPPVRMQLPIKQWELAELIGITPEHLSRLFRHLETTGVIGRKKGWIVIKDLGRLTDESDHVG
jgi:CRP-like cAMP-binding protein